MSDLQEKIKEELAKVDDMNINDEGVHITEYKCISAVGMIPCSSLSMSLACAKKLFNMGQASILIEKVES